MSISILKYHRIDITEDKLGCVVIKILPLNDDFHDSTTIKHLSDGRYVEVETTRNVCTDARKVLDLKEML